MVRASIVQVGSLPTAHPASGRVLGPRTGEQPVALRIERSRIRLVAREARARGAAVSVPVRARMAA